MPVPAVSQELLDSIGTPSRVGTRVGELEFFDGLPTDATAVLGAQYVKNGLHSSSLTGSRDERAFTKVAVPRLAFQAARGSTARSRRSPLPRRSSERSG